MRRFWMMSGQWSWVTWMRGGTAALDEMEKRGGEGQKGIGASGGREGLRKGYFWLEGSLPYRFTSLLSSYLIFVFVFNVISAIFVPAGETRSFLDVLGPLYHHLIGRESCQDRLPLQLAAACQAGAPNIATARHLIRTTHRNAPTVGVGHLGGGRVCGWVCGRVCGRSGTWVDEQEPEVKKGRTRPRP